MKTVIELLTAIEEGENPIDAVLKRELEIINDEKLHDKDAGLHYVKLTLALRSDLQAVLARYQKYIRDEKKMELKLEKAKELLGLSYDFAKKFGMVKKSPSKGFTPNYIHDFTLFTIGQVENFVKAEYFDDRINGNVTINIDLNDLGSWILEKQYNKINVNPTGPEQEPEERTHTIEDFLSVLLEKWHVLEFLIERGIF